MKLQKHPNYKMKTLDYFKKMENNLKSQRLDATGTFHQQNSNVVESSFEIALQIAKQKKPHTIGELLIKPCIIWTVSLLFGEFSAKKVQQVSASNDTVKRRILIKSTDVKEQIIQEIKASPFLAFQLFRHKFALSAACFCKIHEFRRHQRWVLIMY